MGIPRFYRWLSERFPLINEQITAEQIPEFDNLYLDMNGIIHNCSHNNSGGSLEKDESAIFVEAFKYICRLVHIIKPKQLLYMAIDGCAPRAKMNQQRSRRFRAANDAREIREKAEEMGEVITSAAFDSNCITPGTEFMARLTQHLRFFAYKKIQEDPLWQGITVIVSGPDVPGEGEHKVMDYIRTAKAQPDYDPNLRHCLYGLDADLIMLALASHEPHFALLREEVVFGRQQTESVEQRMLLNKDRFQLLHISLVREYLDLEFAPSKDRPVNYAYNLERIIDDFLLFCVLVGNDFLPHLPFSEIGDGGLENFLATYKHHVTTCKVPWLTKTCGDIDWENFSSFLERYATIEEDKLQAAVDDQAFVLGTRRSVGPKGPDGEEPRSQNLILDPPQTVEDARVQYYEVKFDIDVQTHDGAQKQRKLFNSYLEGLQWVLHYYYRGPDMASWGWYYPYYHCPMIYDLVSYDKLRNPGLRFEVGEPFKPFQQLMAVLPSHSKDFLPKCYQWLFEAPNSPVLENYPKHFDIDQDGVKVPWGGVTLIPFIDPTALLDAMRNAEALGPALSPEEQNRNAWGSAMAFKFDLSTSTSVESTMPHRFGNIARCTVRATNFSHPALPRGTTTFVNNVLPGCNRYMSGFPTLHRHALTSSFESGVKVFQFEARSQSLVVHLHPNGPMVPEQEAIGHILKAPCAQIDFPMVHRGRVVAVHTAQLRYFPNGKTAPNTARDHENIVRQISMDLRRKGLTLQMGQETGGDAAAGRSKHHAQQQGLDENWLQQPLAEVMPLESSYLDSEGRIQYRFKTTSEFRLLHLVRIQEPEVPLGPRSLAERFPRGTRVVCIAEDSECFGQVGAVEQNASDNGLEACFERGLTCEEQRQLQYDIQCLVKKQHESLKWHDLATVAQQASLSVHVTNLIFRTLWFRSTENVREDIGMNLICESKHDGSALCLPAFSMRSPNGWFFSDLAVDALRGYVAKYPQLFVALRSRKERDRDLEAPWVFKQKSDVEYEFQQLVKYCKGCDFKKLRLVPEQHMALTPATIAEAVAAVDAVYKQLSARPVQVERIRGQKRLYKAEDVGSLPPSELMAGEDLMIGQRVIFVKPYGLVPCGAKGTVVGIYGTGHAQELELLLDEDSFGATGLNGRAPGMRGLRGSASAFMPLQPRLTANSSLTPPLNRPYAPDLGRDGGSSVQDWLTPESKNQSDHDDANGTAKDMILGMLKSSLQGAAPAEPRVRSDFPGVSQGGIRLAKSSLPSASSAPMSVPTQVKPSVSSSTDRILAKLKGGAAAVPGPGEDSSTFPSEEALPLPKFGLAAPPPPPPPADRREHAGGYPSSAAAGSKGGRWGAAGAEDGAASANSGSKAEKRIASDGNAYTYKEFVEFFGAGDGASWWKGAAPQEQRSGQKKGPQGGAVRAQNSTNRAQQRPNPEIDWGKMFDDLLLLGQPRR